MVDIKENYKFDLGVRGLRKARGKINYGQDKQN